MMITRILRAFPLLYKGWRMLYFIVVSTMILACSDNREIYIHSQDKENIIQLSIPDAELVQVRSVATERECIIEDIQVFVYNDAYTNTPMYYQEGKKNELSFLFGNGTASPTVTLKKYVPKNGERIYVVCNLTDRSSASGGGDFLIGEMTSEEGLRNYASQGHIRGFSSLQGEEQTIPMYGWIEWNETATSNVCLLTRCLAKIIVDADMQSLFSNKVVYWEWQNLNYSDFTLDSGYKGGIYQGSIHESGISEKYDLLSATTPLDEAKGLVTNYYPLEYKHSTYAVGNRVDEKRFSKERAMLLLTVQNPDGSNKEYYRLDFWDKETGKYLDIVRNHSYRFHITKLKSKGYSSVEEAIQNPGSNIEYTIIASDNWSQGFGSNGQYLIKTDREKIELLEGGIKDPVIMVKLELQADDTGNVDLNDVTTRKIRILNSDKETLVASSAVCLFYSVDNQNLIQANGEDGLPVNEANLPQGSNAYWVYCNVLGDSSLKEGYLEITIGNIIKYIPFSIIPHSKAIAIDEDGPANSFITPVTYGVYSFDATVMGNGVEGILSETRRLEQGFPLDEEEIVQYEDQEKFHFKDAIGNDISVSGNVIIAPQSAKLLWQDKEGLISQVAFNLRTNRVEFLSKGTGNGIIAVYDKSDPNEENAKVLWSWHIWCTEKPNIIQLGLPTNGDIYSGKNYKIMDRDLGATTNTPDKLTTCGLGYQWGRKDPFVGALSLGSKDNASLYNVRGNSLPFEEKEMTEEIGTINYAIRHPEVLIVDEADWLYFPRAQFVGNHFLWGNPYAASVVRNVKSKKTIYDPCPTGYKVPPQDIYGVLLKNSVIPSHLADDLTPGRRIEGVEDFYSPSNTQYGLYFYYGENGKQNLFLMSGSVRIGGKLRPLRYVGYTSANLIYYGDSGTDLVLSFMYSIKSPLVEVEYSFGGDISGRGAALRSWTGTIRCVRDE